MAAPLPPPPLASNESEYPNGPCPPEKEIKSHIRSTFVEVGPAVTMAILRKRLSTIYKIDFKEHIPSLYNWIQQVIKGYPNNNTTEPETTTTHEIPPLLTQDELKQEGNSHFQRQEFRKAIKFYTLAIEKDPLCDDAAPILSNRSLCYYNIRKFKEAYEDANACCGIRPAWAKGFARRGFAAEELKEWKTALENYDEYLNLDPADAMGVTVQRTRLESKIESMMTPAERHQNQLRQVQQILANLDVQEMPQWAIDAIDHEQKEYPDLCIMDVSEKQCAIFQSVSTKIIINEEFLRLMFNALAEQNLSAYWVYSTNAISAASTFICQTPLIQAIFSCFPVDHLQTLIEIRPKLIHTPMFYKDQLQGHLLVVYPFGALVELCVRNQINSQDDVRDFRQWVLEIAKFLFEEGDLNYYTTIAHRQNGRFYFDSENKSALIESGDLKHGQQVFDAANDPQAPPGKQVYFSSMLSNTAKDYLEKQLELYSDHPPTAYVLYALEKFCEDYERKRGNKDGKGKVRSKKSFLFDEE